MKALYISRQEVLNCPCNTTGREKAYPSAKSDCTVATLAVVLNNMLLNGDTMDIGDSNVITKKCV
jgi:hypothetical protein